jgi:iron only hydrogenase large subunit-like protein
MGSVVKTHLSSKLKISPDKVFHLTVMPCFDKKLEASRADFKNEATNSHDVDMVITPVEIEQVLFNVIYIAFERLNPKRPHSRCSPNQA